MYNLSIDLETYSSVDIKKAGAWRYIGSPDFEILLFSYSLDYAEPVCIDFAMGEVLPLWLADALTNPNYLKKAYNAPFEWGCLSKYIGRPSRISPATTRSCRSRIPWRWPWPMPMTASSPKA